MAYIYQVTNDINGKIYVGMTDYKNPEDRWKIHLRDYKRKFKEKRPFYNAMKKYGPEHFHFRVIEETDNPEEREQYWIQKLRTYVGFDDCKGYNATLGGDGRKGKDVINRQHTYNEDEIIKYHTTKAKYIAIRTAKRFNISRNTLMRILGNKGIKWLGDEEAISVIMYEKYQGIYQIDADTGLIINVFMTIKDAASFNKISENWLRKVIKGKLKTTNYPLYKGFYWYRGNNLPNIYKTQKEYNLHFIDGRTTREKLKSEIRTMPFTKVGELYGVSDNAIRKWCVRMGLPSKSTVIKMYSDEEWKTV